MDDSPAIDAFHQHEVLHTAHMICSMFEEFVVEYQFTQSDPRLKAAADKLGRQLADFHQLTGNIIDHQSV